MRTLTIILTFFTLSASAQDSLYWTGSGHSQYNVQQSKDGANWKTIAVVPGVKDSLYVAPIPGATYYYRVNADEVNSATILVYAPQLLPVKNIYNAHIWAQ